MTCEHAAATTTTDRGATRGGDDRPPLISVVTPSYNQGTFLSRCIESVLAQGYPRFEHIVQDNASTDATRDVLRRYPHVDWVSEADHGQSDALNRAIARARGEIIAWINADDAYEPGAFEVAARLLNRATGTKIIAGRVRLVDEHGKLIETFTPAFEGLDYLVEFWAHAYGLCQPGVLFRRELVEELGLFRTDLHYAMDYDFWLRVATRYPVALVDDVLARYVVHPASKTGGSRYGSGFRDELERVSRRYWGAWYTPQRWRRAAACGRHAADMNLHALLDAHKRGEPFDWRLFGRMLRRRPATACNRNVTALVGERLLGQRQWHGLKRVVRTAAGGPTR